MMYSKFRNSLLVSSILVMQEDFFDTFKRTAVRNGMLAAGVSDGSEAATTVSPTISAMPQPFWLRQGYILADHCSATAKKQ